MNEFQIIDHFFKKQNTSRSDVKLGIGDDAAILNLPPDSELLLSTDSLVENVHFLPNIAPADLGYRSLAVNLSDIAAMGGEPSWVLLNLTMPKIDEAWLEQFCQGFFLLAEQFNIALVGGNLAKGPLNIGIQIAGFVPMGQALRRDGAKVGDKIYITGRLGLARSGLNYLKRAEENPCTQNFLRPQARVKQGIALRTIAHSCIDISDGLLADLQHILDASQVGALIDVNKIPIANELNLQEALNAGEDYELCFTAAPSAKIPFAAYCIGEVTAEPLLKLQQDNKPLKLAIHGYKHFP